VQAYQDSLRRIATATNEVAVDNRETHMRKDRRNRNGLAED